MNRRSLQPGPQGFDGGLESDPIAELEAIHHRLGGTVYANLTPSRSAVSIPEVNIAPEKRTIRRGGQSSLGRARLARQGDAHLAGDFGVRPWKRRAETSAITARGTRWQAVTRSGSERGGRSARR